MADITPPAAVVETTSMNPPTSSYTSERSVSPFRQKRYPKRDSARSAAFRVSLDYAERIHDAPPVDERSALTYEQFVRGEFETTIQTLTA